ncbi:MAG: response regulator [Methylobacter sp.]|nr:response regulator [Methylobacter sp.]
MINSHKWAILLVEDSDEDAAALRRVIEKNNWQITLHRSVNVEDAMAFLRAQGGYNKSQEDDFIAPALILLDLNLPGTDGRELLRNMKKDELLKSMPIIILSTSSNPIDIEECYRYGANSYQIKSVNFAKFSDSINALFSYWFETAILPPATMKKII